MDYGSRASGDHLAPTPRFSYTLVRRHVLFRRGCGSTHLDTTAMQWRGSVTAAVRHDRGAVTQRRGIGMATHRASRCCSRRASQLRQPVAPAYGPAHAAPIAPVTASRRSPARAATHVTVQRPPVAAASSIRGPLRLYSSVAAAWQRRGSGLALGWQRLGSGAARQRCGTAGVRCGSGVAAVAPASRARQSRQLPGQLTGQPTLRPSRQPSRPSPRSNPRHSPASARRSSPRVGFRRSGLLNSRASAALQRRGSGTAAVRQQYGSGTAAALQGCGTAAVRQRRGSRNAARQPIAPAAAAAVAAASRSSLRASPRGAHRDPARAATHVAAQPPPVAAALFVSTDLESNRSQHLYTA